MAGPGGMVPVIPATRESTNRKMVVQASPGPYLKNNQNAKKGWEYGSSGKALAS
jgi:hypothetical protein